MPHQCTNCASVFPDGSKEMLSGCPHCGGNTFQYIPEGADPAQYEPESTDPPDPPIDEDSVTGRVGRAASSVREYVNARRDEDSSDSTAVEDTPSEVEDTPSKLEAESTRTESPSPESDEQTAHTDAAPSGGETGAKDSAKREPSREDRAQASARGEVADLSDLSSQSQSETTGTGSTTDSTTSSPTPSDAGSDETESVQSGDPPESKSTGPPRENARVVDEPDEAATTDIETLRAELNDQFESIRIVEPGQYELNLMELYDREEHIIALREDGKYKIEVPD
ncbi:MAG: Zn-ribbon containing protein, partial [Halodesulfurarchaeum sp.]